MKTITTADARKHFADIVNRVAYGKDAFVLTRRGEPMAALVSLEDLRVLQEIEDKIDIEDARRARNEPGETVSWEDLKKELGL